MRSSSGKKGRFASLTAIPTTTLSYNAEARRTRSWCPSVIGSNVPGYTALIIDPTCQEMKVHIPCARLPEDRPAARHFEMGLALDVHAPAIGQETTHQTKRRDLKIQAIRRIDEHDVEARARFPGEF